MEKDGGSAGLDAVVNKEIIIMSRFIFCFRADQRVAFKYTPSIFSFHPVEFSFFQFFKHDKKQEGG